MSANSDKGSRVTRSMRRLNSIDSQNQDLEVRSETPTSRLRITKLQKINDGETASPTRRTTRGSSLQKDDPITTPGKQLNRAGSIQRSITESYETVLTPTKRFTRAGSIQRMEEQKASPLRRTTRRMSSENENLINKESSIIVIEDDSISENALTPRVTKASRRISTMAKLEEVMEIEEEPVTTENKSDNQLNKSSDSSNELELRNRSISKSPIVTQVESLNSVENDLIESVKNEEVQNIEETVTNENETTSPTKRLKNFFKSLISFSGSEVSGDEVKNRSSPQLTPVNNLSQRKSTSRRSQKFVEEDNLSGDNLKNTSQTNSNENSSPKRSKNGLQELEKVESSPIKNPSPRKSISKRFQKSLDADNNDTIEKIQNQSETNFNENTNLSQNTSQEMEMVDDKSNVTKSSLIEFSPTKSSCQPKSTPRRSKKFMEDDMLVDEASTLNSTKEIQNENNSPNFSQNSMMDLEKQIDESVNVDNLTESKLIDGENWGKSTNRNEDSPKETNKSQSSLLSTSQLRGEKKLNDPEKFIESEKSKIVEENTEISETLVSDMLQDFVSEPSPAKNESLGKHKALDKSKIENEESPEKSKESPNSWNQSVRLSSSQSIDKMKVSEKEVIKSKIDRSKIISSDESEDDQASEKNSLIDDEAEVGSEDSMTPSERKEIEENEVVDEGKSLGSEDSEFDEDEDDEYEKDSFIDSNEDISDGYSMDSEDEVVEEIETQKKKRRSRIIKESSSESEEKSPLKSPGDNSNKSKVYTKESEDVERMEVDKNKIDENKICESPQKKPQVVVMSESTKRNSLNKSIDKQSKSNRKSLEEKEDETFTKRNKRKRDIEDIDDEIFENPVNSKRAKLMSANESEALHMENVSHLNSDENTELQAIEENNAQEKEKKKSKKKHDVDINDIYDRVNKHMEEYEANKKAKAALKKERKAKKLAKKMQQQLEEKEQNGEDGDDKENALKKKKKKKYQNKQKHVDDDENKEQKDLSARIELLQQKMKLKRQRKREKKLAKMQKQEEIQTEEPIEEIIEKKKSVKSKKIETQVEENIEKKKSDKSKKSEISTDAIVEKKGSKELKKSETSSEESVAKKKEKKSKVLENTVTNDDVQVSEIKKKKKKKNAEKEDVVPEPEVKSKSISSFEPNTSKKRKIEEIGDDLNDIIQKPRMKKKLKVLSQIDEPIQHVKQIKHFDEPKQIDSAINLNKKLKKIIPVEMNRVARKTKKQKNDKKPISEPKLSLPRPVFTTAGYFIEEPITPYKFKSSEYKPIKSKMGHERVVLFQSKKKSLANPSVVDYKMEILKKNKNRDKSIKNLKNLI